MRNLKRVLSLALAAMMLIGMMTVGAFAASSEDFADYGEIKHTEAVDTMVALNVIDGIKSGDTYNFKPEGTLTRAQMSKIISYVMNGGVEPVLGVKDVPTYSDIDNHWAEKYIEYCTSMGIIAGVGNGKFNPDGTLTGEQAAKMLLTAMGYNANVFGFVGANWSTNVNRYANEAGLYDELGDMNPSEPISRDNACQLAYNALQGTMMKRTWNQDMATGEVGETYAPWYDAANNPVTLLGQKFNAVVEYGYMTDATYDVDKGEYTYDFTAAASLGGAAITTDAVSQTSLTTTMDVTGLYGQQVKVIYKNSASENYPVYGIYANNSSVLLSGVIGDLPDDLTATASSMKIDGTTYRFKGWDGTSAMKDEAQYVNVVAYVNGTIAAVGGLDNLAADVSANRLENEWKFDLIDNDGDGKANCMVVYPFTVEKVTYVGSENITLDSGVGSKDLEDINVYEGIAKNDYVAHTAAGNTVDNKETFVKADVVEGTVDAVKNTNSVQIDGTWYTWAGNYGGGAQLTNTNLGATVKLQVVNGYYFDSEITLAQADTNLLYISAADAASASLGKTTLKAKAYFTDGSSKTITIDEVNDNAAAPVRVDLSSSDPQIGSYAISAGNNNVVVGMMYRYTVDSDGNYELFAMDNTDATTRANYDKYDQEHDNISYSTSTGRLSLNGASYVVPDDAVVIAQTTNGTGAETKVVSGKALKNWDWTTLNAHDDDLTIQVLAMTVNGISNVKVMTFVNSYTNATVSGADSTAYGYVLSGPSDIKVDNVTCEQFVIWNGTEEITVYQEGTASGIVKGDFVSYETESENEITALATVGTAYAVTGMNADGTVLDLVDEANTAVTAAKIDADDTTVIYVNTKDVKGVEGGSVTLANEPASGVFEMNVVAATNGNGTAMDVIFVDTNNVVAGTTPVAADATNTDGIQDQLNNGGNASFDASNLTAADDVTVPNGGKLTITDLDDTNKLTVNMEAGAELVLPTIETTDKIEVTVPAGATVTVNGQTIIGTGGAIQLPVAGRTAGDAYATSVKLTSDTSGNLVVTAVGGTGTGANKLETLAVDTTKLGTTSLKFAHDVAAAIKINNKDIIGGTPVVTSYTGDITVSGTALTMGTVTAAAGFDTLVNGFATTTVTTLTVSENQSFTAGTLNVTTLNGTSQKGINLYGASMVLTNKVNTDGVSIWVDKTGALKMADVQLVGGTNPAFTLGDDAQLQVTKDSSILRYAIRTLNDNAATATLSNNFTVGASEKLEVKDATLTIAAGKVLTLTYDSSTSGSLFINYKSATTALTNVGTVSGVSNVTTNTDISISSSSSNVTATPSSSSDGTITGKTAAAG